jgi:PKD repeat protein
MNATNALEDSFGGFTNFNGVAGAPHQSPTANFVASAQATPADTVEVDAGASASEDGIASYSWDFGDGNGGSGETATHTYAAAGTYQVTLTVDDGEQCPGQVTDGRRIICQGSSQATVTKSVTVG